MAIRTRGGWLRPALDGDVSAFHLNLLGDAHASIVDLLAGRADIVWLSPGVLFAGLIALGVIVSLLKPARFSLVAGLLLCASVMGLASTAVNHPKLIARLDQQHEQRLELLSVLRKTAYPPVEIAAAPRLRGPVATAEGRGGLLRGFIYLRYPGSLLLLSAGGLVFSLRGRLSRRLGGLAVCLLIGAAGATTVCLDRLTAEWRWQQAVEADVQGACDEAESFARAAVEAFPELGDLQRTPIFLGKLDHRRGVKSPRRTLFLAHQWSQNGNLPRAIELLKRYGAAGGAERVESLMHADLVAQLASARFAQGRWDAAADLWQRAYELDPDQTYRRLFSPVVTARALRDKPERIAAMIDPLLDRMVDRSLRGALLSLLGDVYFQAGALAEAQRRYHASQAAYSLPKHINYRTQRGLTGM